MPIHRARPRPLGALVSAALALAAAPAAAQPAAEPIRITFSAAPGCPAEADFTGQIRARTARARLAEGSEPARTFRVDVSPTRAGFRGRLAIEDPSGSSAIREVSGTSCEEVLSALGLIAALAIDPKASTAAKPPPAPVTAPVTAPATAPATVTATTPAPVVVPVPASAPVFVPAPSPFPPLPLPVWLPPYVEAPPRWRPGLGAHAAAFFAIAPEAAPGVLVFGELARTGGAAFSPALRLGLELARSPTLRIPTGTAAFSLVAGRLEACPTRLTAGSLSLLPCLALEAGALRAGGTGTTYSTSVDRPWVTAGLAARAEIAVSRWISLEAQGALTLPFIRDSFYLEPDITAHDVPAVGGTLGGGAALHF